MKRPNRSHESSRRSHKKIQEEALERLGRECVSCGRECIIPGVIWHHVTGEGKRHRREIANGRHPSSVQLLYDLKRRGWPKKGFRAVVPVCSRECHLLEEAFVDAKTQEGVWPIRRMSIIDEEVRRKRERKRDNLNPNKTEERT